MTNGSGIGSITRTSSNGESHPAPNAAGAHTPRPIGAPLGPQFSSNGAAASADTSEKSRKLSGTKSMVRTLRSRR